MLSTTSTYPILMLFGSCVLCSFLGCIVSLVVFALRENGFHQETTLTVLIYIYLVYSIISIHRYMRTEFHYVQWWQLSLIFSWLPYTQGFMPVFILESDFFYSHSPESITYKYLLFFSDSRRICLSCNGRRPPGLLFYKIGLLYT